MGGIPDLVLFDMLTKLPVKSLLRLMLVNKHWCSMINNNGFILPHLDCSRTQQESSTFILTCYGDHTLTFFSLNSSPDKDEPVTVAPIYAAAFDLNLPDPSSAYDCVHHCDGLVFAHCCNENFLCNPQTQKIVKLPESNGKGGSATAFALGFDHSTKQHKIIKVLNYGNIEIFTLGTNSWRMVRGIQPLVMNCPGRVVFANGFFYWCGVCSNGSICILSFHVQTEKFGVVPIPEVFSEPSRIAKFFRSLFVLGGKLCLVNRNLSFEEGKRRLDIWMLEEFGWVQETIVHPSLSLRHAQPVVIQDGQVLLHEHGVKELIWYNIHTQNFRQVKIKEFPSPTINQHPFGVYPYVESLVPVN